MNAILAFLSVLPALVKSLPEITRLMEGLINNIQVASDNAYLRKKNAQLTEAIRKAREEKSTVALDALFGGQT